MGKFKNNRFYIIIADSEITLDILNYSTSVNASIAPSKTSAGVLFRILEFNEPGPDIVSTYTWYDQDAIIPAWEALP